MQDELLVDIVADSLAEAKAKAKTLGHTVVDVKAVTLNDRVTDTQVEAEAWKLGDILTAVKDKALVDTLANMLTETEAAILCQTLVDVEARHWFKTWLNWKKRLTLGVKLSDQKANGLVDTSARRGGEAKTLVDNLGDVDINLLNNKLAKKLAQVKTGTHGDTLGNVEPEVLVDALAQKQADLARHWSTF